MFFIRQHMHSFLPLKKEICYKALKSSALRELSELSHDKWHRPRRRQWGEARRSRWLLRSVFPKFHQHIEFPTRGSNTLGLVFTNIFCREAPLPSHLQLRPSCPAHSSIQTQRETEQIQGSNCQGLAPGGNSHTAELFWDYAVGHLQGGCHTWLCQWPAGVHRISQWLYWQMYRWHDCGKKLARKPWVSELWVLLRARNADFRAGDDAAYRSNRKELSQDI